MTTPSQTPETARTAARETPEWKAIYDDINKGVQYTDMSIAPALLADVICNAIERLERRLTPPPASKGRHLEDVTNPVADPEFVASMPTPAGETVSVARDVAEKYVREPVTYRGDMRDACIAALSTPPGHTRVVSNANYSLATPDADVAAGSTQPGPLVERPPPDACWRELRVVAEDAADCILRGVPQHAEANRLRDLAIACSFVTPPTPPAVDANAARPGFTYPDEAVEELLTLIKWRRTTSPTEFYHVLDSRASALRASRVSNAKQADAGVAVPADDRAWEKDVCVLRLRDTRWYVFETCGGLYLWDGAWLTPGQWNSIPDPGGWYLSESAARAALAKAPKPPMTGGGA